MAEDRLAAGVDRIERALARIATAAGAPTRPAADAGELEAVRARHEGLKAEVARALDELDALVRG